MSRELAGESSNFVARVEFPGDNVGLRVTPLVQRGRESNTQKLIERGDWRKKWQKGKGNQCEMEIDFIIEMRCNRIEFVI
jgi:hypothetical protein